MALSLERVRCQCTTYIRHTIWFATRHRWDRSSTMWLQYHGHRRLPALATRGPEIPLLREDRKRAARRHRSSPRYRREAPSCSDHPASSSWRIIYLGPRGVAVVHRADAAHAYRTLSQPGFGLALRPWASRHALIWPGSRSPQSDALGPARQIRPPGRAPRGHSRPRGHRRPGGPRRARAGAATGAPRRRRRGRRS